MMLSSQRVGERQERYKETSNAQILEVDGATRSQIMISAREERQVRTKSRKDAAYWKRRDLLNYAAFAASGVLVPRRVWGSGTRPASETVGVAVIGVAGQGLWNIQQLLDTDAAIVALCDVDERRSGEARTLCPRAHFFVDFRDMLDRAGRDIDAVLVATPDHTHAVATIAALQAGKHVYCEKPLAHSVWETRQVMTAARKYNRVTQLGIQRHAGRNYRRVVELIRAGTIGPVREVHAWCPTVWSGRGMGFQPINSGTGFQPVTRPAAFSRRAGMQHGQDAHVTSHGQDARATDARATPVPAGLNWDLWLGPAPYRPYADNAYVPAAWRGWWDFGGGACADMGCHFLDLAYWALDLGHPATIEAQGPPVDAESAPEWLKVRYEYRAQGSRAASIPAGAPGPMPPVTLTWTVGRKGPPAEFKEKVPDWKEGVLFIGDEGMLLADFNRFKLLPASRVGSAHRWAEPTLPDAPSPTPPKPSSTCAAPPAPAGTSLRCKPHHPLHTTPAVRSVAHDPQQGQTVRPTRSQRRVNWNRARHAP